MLKPTAQLRRAGGHASSQFHGYFGSSLSSMVEAFTPQRLADAINPGIFFFWRAGYQTLTSIHTHREHDSHPVLTQFSQRLLASERTYE